MSAATRCFPKPCCVLATLLSLHLPAVQVLAGHVVPVALRVADLHDGQVLPTLAGEPLTVSVDESTGIVSVAAAAGGSVAALAPFDGFEACSAVVHVVDSVLIPGDAATAEVP